MKRYNYRVFGEKQPQGANPENAQSSTETNEPNPTQEDVSKNYDEEIFDDTDFYQSLLKEIVDDSVENEEVLKKLLREKKKKKTKKTNGPSKGRKIE